MEDVTMRDIRKHAALLEKSYQNACLGAQISKSIDSGEPYDQGYLDHLTDAGIDLFDQVTLIFPGSELHAVSLFAVWCYGESVSHEALEEYYTNTVIYRVGVKIAERVKQVLDNDPNADIKQVAHDEQALMTLEFESILEEDTKND